MTGFHAWHCMAALGVLTRLAACVALAPLVVLGYWHLRYEGVKHGKYRWHRHDIGTAGLTLQGAS